MSDDRKKPTSQSLTDWLGLTDAPRWWLARPLGIFAGVIISAFIIVSFPFAMVATLAVMYGTVRDVLASESVGPNLGAGALIAAILGAPFVIWSTVIKHRALGFQKEGHLTDRISAAVEQLGAEKTVKKDSVEATVPNIEVRIGGILSLERIAQDSTAYDNGRDHVRVMEILCAYVRHNAPRAKDDDGTAAPPPRLDIQKALDVIKRRGRSGRDIEAQERYRLDLRETDLRGYDLSRGDFVGAVFWRSNLAQTNFAHSDLTGTQFFGSLIENAFFFQSILKGTQFDKCEANNSGFLGGFSVAKLEAISIEGAKLPHIFFSSESAWRVLGSRDTEISPTLASKINAGRELAESRMYLELGIDGEKERLEHLEAKVAAAEDGAEQFAHWNTFTHSDLASDRFRQKFKAKHNLIGWPFAD
jgi:hypothetical protein